MVVPRAATTLVVIASRTDGIVPHVAGTTAAVASSRLATFILFLISLDGGCIVWFGLYLGVGARLSEARLLAVCLGQRSYAL